MNDGTRGKGYVLQVRNPRRRPYLGVVVVNSRMPCSARVIFRNSHRHENHDRT